MLRTPILLKFLSCIGIISIYIPMAALILTTHTPPSFLELGTACIFLIVSAIIAYLNALARQSIIDTISLILLLLIIVFLSYNTFLVELFMIGITLGVYFHFRKLFAHGTPILFTPFHYFLILLTITCYYIMTYLFTPYIPQSYLAIVYSSIVLLNGFILAFLRNAESLDDIFVRALPDEHLLKTIQKRHQTALLLFGFFLILGVIVFSLSYDWIIGLLKSVIGLIFKVLSLLKLSSFNFNKTPSTIESQPPTNLFVENESSYLFGFIFLLGISLFILKNAPVILRGIYNTFKRISQKLHTLLSITASSQSSKDTEIFYGYSDYVEKLPIEPPLEKARKKSFKKWKKDLKSYKKGIQNASKYLDGYELIKEWAALQKISFSSSYTPRELIPLLSHCIDKSILITTEKILYGYYTPNSNDFLILDQALKTLSK